MDNRTVKINAHREMLERLAALNERGETPKILLHACCAPCASSCLEVLDRFCDVGVFFYNPNITVKSEYDHRLAEIERLIGEMPFRHRIELIRGDYDPDRFLEMAQGLENEPERGARCLKCYRLRLEAARELFERGGYDLFATTLTLSPLKPADIINSIGRELSGEYYLATDFKKDNGYPRSIELSKQYGLYRQNYCGCVFSRRDG